MERELIIKSLENCISSKECSDCEWHTCKTLHCRKVGIPIDLALAVVALIVELNKQDALLSKEKSCVI